MNGCSYCLSAHTAIGKLYGVADEELDASRRAVSGDPKKQAALEFAQAVARNRGAISDAEFDRAPASDTVARVLRTGAFSQRGVRPAGMARARAS